MGATGSFYKLKLIEKGKEKMSLGSGEYCRVTAILTDTNGSQIQNVYYFRHTGGTTLQNAALATGIEAFMSTLYEIIDTYIPTSVTPYLISLDKVAFVDGELQVTADLGSIAWTTWAGGESSSDGLPQGVAAVVNFPVDEPRVQGRKFLGPFAESAQEDGDLISAVLAEVAAYAAALISGTSFGGATLNNFIASSKTAAFIEVTAYVANAIMGYQRRRKKGVGR